jgi:hypothetical protein
VVLRGQYLERAVVIPTDDGPLEGLFHRGKKKLGVLICPPGPMSGGSMESAVVAELGYAITRAGHPTLRFNFAGVGASPGTFREADGVRAALAALEHLEACLPEAATLALCGVGLGAEVAAELADRRCFETAFLTVPRPGRLPPRVRATDSVVVAVPQQGPAADADALQAWGEGAVRDFRLVNLPRADPVFRRGLVELGRAAAETFSPPGLLELQ